MLHVAPTKATVAFLGRILTRPQKVMGPPAAAANSRVAAGAVPMPTSSNAATRGISNIRGTFINTPIVAATATPVALLPRNDDTVAGLIHWTTSPLAKPAMTMMGPNRTKYPTLALAHKRTPSKIASRQEVSGSSMAIGDSGGSISRPPLPAAMATSGPISNAPKTLSAIRDPESMGAKTRTAIVRAGVLGDSLEEFDAPMQVMTGRGPDSPHGPHLVLLPVSDTTPGGDKANESERRRVEADAVAREVASLVKRGASVLDRETGSYRAARPADVAILLRRLTNVHLFELALESHGVPYRTPAGGGFFTRQEVLDLTNLLGWLAEPDDDIALVGALRSPLFMIDDQTLLALRSSKRPLLETLSSPPESVSGETPSFCTRAAEVLSELRCEVPFAAPDTLIEKTVVLTGFEAAWAPLQGGDQALANIRKFVGLARTLGSHSLDELVSYIRRRRDELEAREGQAVLDASDAVRLLTIHGAKGLEFPIVLVPEAHLPSRGTYDPVRWRTDEGISLTLDREIGASGSRRRPGFYSHLMERDGREEVSEHRRLLYVAATRAADKLYLSGDDSRSGDGWLTYVREALEESPLDGVEIHPPVPVDLDAIARRPQPTTVTVPSPGEESGHNAHARGPSAGDPAAVEYAGHRPAEAASSHARPPRGRTSPGSWKPRSQGH